MITLIAFLLVAHFLGDFTHFSTQWMLKGKREADPGPILAHGSVHGLLAGIVSLIFFRNFYPALVSFALIGSIHFAIDLLQAKIRLSDPRFQTFNGYWYWYLLGFDQLLHGLTILFVVYHLNSLI